MIGFCHDIRNRLYHKGDDDSLLIKVALSTLYEIILNRQPQWGGGTDIIRVPVSMDGSPIDMEHPYTKKRRSELGAATYKCTIYEIKNAQQKFLYVTRKY